MTDATVTKKSKNPKAPKLFPDELIDQLLAQVQGKDAESILGESGLAGQLKKQLAERMLAAELSHHLEAETEQGKAGNHRNGTSPKTVLTPNGELKLDIPRDRQATFEPQLVGKYQRRPPGFDDSRYESHTLFRLTLLVRSLSHSRKLPNSKSSSVARTPQSGISSNRKITHINATARCE